MSLTRVLWRCLDSLYSDIIPDFENTFTSQRDSSCLLYFLQNVPENLLASSSMHFPNNTVKHSYKMTVGLWGDISTVKSFSCSCIESSLLDPMWQLTTKRFPVPRGNLMPPSGHQRHCMHVVHKHL